ncbi:MAG: enoyl-CoA hydratase/isomerase family protein [Porticoccaceae bacterium]
MSEHLKIIYEDQGIVRLEIDKPPINALDMPMVQAFLDVLDKIETDDSLRCMVIIGTGRSFCSGEDLKTLGDTGEDQDLFTKLVDRIEATRIPVIAAINGFCIGGGMELAMCCDLRLASTNASIACAGVNLGLLGGTYRLPKIIGEAYAKRLLYTGERVGADVALQYGFVTSVHEPEELLDAAMQLARRIASRAPLSVEATKRMVSRMDLPRKENDAWFDKELKALIKTQDHKEAMVAFKEKRDPIFKRI